MLADDLKALKVADLRRILATANNAAPARATKADLVTRILDSKDAQDAHLALYPQQQPLQPPPSAAATAAPQSQPTHASSPPQQQQPQKDASLSPEDLELEKRKARAARFGIPLVNDDSEKLKARAKRFGSAAASAVDPEELEKRQRRAERFGTNPPAAS